MGCANYSTLVKLFIQFLIILIISVSSQKRDTGGQLIERKVDDLKEFKKLLRTKNNVLMLFVKHENVVGSKRLLSVFADVADKVYGKATLAFLNCGSEEGKKTCKKLKISPEPYILKHYNNGDFHKDYDRAETAESMLRFLADPTGEMPWEEDTTATNVLHIPDSQFWMKYLRREKLPILAMFYAPWCGYCKRLKPEYAEAATILKNKCILAALDVTRAENYELQQVYNITGFPTLLYFADGKFKFSFGGEQTKDGIIKWMENPTAGKEGKASVVEELPWSEEASDVVHLTDETFDKFLSENPSVLVMFYAPWCGHCKRMKPDYMEAAKKLKEENSKSVIAAVDATKEKKVATDYEIKGFPTVKYFKEGKFAWDFNERTMDGILNFMKDPQEPPPPPPAEQPWHEVESDVMHLSAESFKAELKKRKHVLVMFYAPWCGHCKKAKPEFMVAASKFKDDPKVAFAAIDCTVHQDVCRQYGIQGYPTFKYFSYLKTVANYESGRTASDFANYITFLTEPLFPTASGEPTATPPAAEESLSEEKKSKIPPSPYADNTDTWDPAVKMLTPETIDSVFASVDRTLVMFFAPWCGHCQKAKPEYMAAANYLKDRKDVVIAAVDCVKYGESICQEKRIMGYPSFVIYSKTGEYIDIHRGGLQREDYVKTMIGDDFEAKMSSPPPPQPPATKPETVAAGVKSEL